MLNHSPCRVFDGTVPPHFYGEMAKTALGCKVLEEKGHFPEFAHFIRQHGLESEDFEIINKLKSVLWAVVSICGSFVVTVCLFAGEGQHRGDDWGTSVP
jgi:hypothetical protein